MIMGFSKLFSDIIHSTVWREKMHVKVVWITMLAMADRHGQVLASIPGLADSAKVTLEECLDALNIFQSPDEYSRTKDYEGRRITEIDGGWLLLNYEKFRERKDDEEQRIKTRERVRKHREKAKDVTPDVTVTPSNDIQKQKQKTDSEADGEPAPPEKPSREIYIGTVLAGVMKNLGTVRLSPSERSQWIDRADLAFDNGFSALEFIECHAEKIKKSPGYTIKPDWVIEELPAFVRSKRKAAPPLPTLAEREADAAMDNAFITGPPKKEMEAIQ